MTQHRVELHGRYVYQKTGLPQVKLVLGIDFHWFNALIGIAYSKIAVVFYG